MGTGSLADAVGFSSVGASCLTLDLPSRNKRSAKGWKTVQWHIIKKTFRIHSSFIQQLYWSGLSSKMTWANQVVVKLLQSGMTNDNVLISLICTIGRKYQIITTIYFHTHLNDQFIWKNSELWEQHIGARIIHSTMKCYWSQPPLSYETGNLWEDWLFFCQKKSRYDYIRRQWTYASKLN